MVNTDFSQFLAETFPKSIFTIIIFIALRFQFKGLYDSVENIFDLNEKEPDVKLKSKIDKPYSGQNFLESKIKKQGKNTPK
ncbi:MAG: hypothetical protein H7196_00355 [candidate division SR1 bacterium]|nr:hypothetical protein [candidate division SR1 bacterium]